MKNFAITCLWSSLAVLIFALPDGGRAEDAPEVHWPGASKSATISAPFAGSTIAIRISSRVAGAVDSLTWGGKQFINSEDHGRELQSAAAYSNKHRECLNPTEAGSASDGLGTTTTSRLLNLKVKRNRLTSETRMAYWIAPKDPRCEPAEGAADGSLSRDVLRKVVTIGAFGLPNVIQYDSTFVVPEKRILAGFEAPTGYMPAEFSMFLAYERKTNEWTPFVPETGYVNSPIILSTPDRQFAMAVYAPLKTIPAIYSVQRFTRATMASPTVKWNVFFRKETVDSAAYAFTTFIVIGTLDDVQKSLQKIIEVGG